MDFTVLLVWNIMQTRSGLLSLLLVYLLLHLSLGSNMTSNAIVAAGEVHDATSTELVAVGEARTHLPPAEELLAIKKLATQTKAIGIILPPPDIRAIIDKTSQFVAKHGQSPDRVDQPSMSCSGPDHCHASR